MRYVSSLLFFVLGLVLLWGAETGRCAEDRPGEPPWVLARAVMCEGIASHRPVNEAVIFSLSLGRVCCYTDFDRVKRVSIVVHNWYRRDRLVTRVKLPVNPPRWATYSRIRLREADRGPWRVDISDTTGKVFRTLRFSVTD